LDTSDSTVFVRALFEVADPLRAEFEEIVSVLRERARHEPGTLTYRVCAAEGGSGYVVLEQYADPAAAMAHNAGAADLLARVEQCAELVLTEIYGPVGPEIRAWADSRPGVSVFTDLAEPPEPPEVTDGSGRDRRQDPPGRDSLDGREGRPNLRG
jgi:quinol monooxygenase YgiN